MRNRTLADLDRVVALGGGHGLGRVLSSLSSLGSRLTGIVTTTDNGGSTGRIRRSEGGIAWGDMRNCLNQLIAEPSIASAMFEYRFSGNGELSGHNLGNLMLKALDHLSVRPLEAINLIRNLLKVDAFLIPMSEQPVDLMAIDHEGHEVYGEVNIDQLASVPRELMAGAVATFALIPEVIAFSFVAGVDLFVFFEPHAGLQRSAVGRDDIARKHDARGRGHHRNPVERNAQHRSGLQQVGIGHVVALLQQAPAHGAVHIAVSETDQRVAPLNAIEEICPVGT